MSLRRGMWPWLSFKRPSLPIRYLTATDQGYYDSLSSASQKSLGFQGGPFRGADLKNFDEDPLRDDMVSLRLWDDAAKLEGIEAVTPRAGAYLDMIVTHLLRES
jgi:predicted HD phosphohydrolase